MAILSDYEALLEFAYRMGFDVKERPLMARDGMIKGRRIAIREDLPEEEKPQVLAHEISHAYLHSGMNLISMGNPAEYEEAADRGAKMIMDMLLVMPVLSYPSAPKAQKKEKRGQIIEFKKEGRGLKVDL